MFVIPSPWINASELVVRAVESICDFAGFSSSLHLSDEDVLQQSVVAKIGVDEPVDPNHRSHGNRKTTLPGDDKSKNNRSIQR